MMMNRILPLMAAACLLTGCGTTLTNLTPAQQFRTPNGLYPLEVAWDSTQQTIKEKTIQASVIVGDQTYPMKPTPMLKNRWEVLVPIPPDRQFINYRYRFDYDYLTIPQPKPSSKLSPPYRLDIIERK